jgi:hypothetical protein
MAAVEDSFSDHLAVETDDGTVRAAYVVCTSVANWSRSIPPVVDADISAFGPYPW